MEETSVVCGECQKTFRHQGFLQVHINAYHDKTVHTCEECKEDIIGKKSMLNHKRKHKGPREKKKVSHRESPRPQKIKESPVCDKCGKSFGRKAHLVRHKLVHQKETERFSCNVCQTQFRRKDNLDVHVENVHVTKVRPEGLIRTAMFEKEKPLREEKGSVECGKCGKSFISKFNLKRHTRKHKSRWTVMRKVRKMITDAEYKKELKKKWSDGDSEAVDDTYVETIMQAIPNMSNRQILKTLTILRKTLPKKHFKKNLRKVIQTRTNMLEEFFTTDDASVKDSKGKSIKMLVTRAKDLNTLIMLACEKRELNEEQVSVVFGIDGGQNKLIATMAIVPDVEKSGEERRKETDYKKQSKSTGCKKCLVVGRVDNVPENRENVKVLVEKLNLPELQKDFKIVADIKLIDIMCGIQSTSSTHPCPYCKGAKLDKNGRETNGKGTFVKGEPRSMKNLREDAHEYSTVGFPNRQTLRHFDSVEFPPLFVHPDQENKLVSELYPPPQLHTGVLGPGNDVLQFLEKSFPEKMEDFKKRHHIKGSGPGNTYNGPTLKRLLENKNGILEDLSKVISVGKPEFQLFIQHLHNLGQLNIGVNMKYLDLELLRTIIGDIEKVFKELQTHFDISMPLKIHIIIHHYLDHFELTGETLLRYTDESVESMHSQLRQFDESHHYKNLKFGSESHARSQHKSIVHINSINIC